MRRAFTLRPIGAACAAAATAAVLIAPAASASAKVSAHKKSEASITAYDPTNYAAFTGSKKGKANPKLSTYYIGWLNQQGGQLTFPDSTIGAQVAVKVINDQLGGIGGHPVALAPCYITQVQDGQTCGQKLANNKKIKVIDWGTVIQGNAAIHTAVGASKANVMAQSTDPSDLTAKNTVLLTGNLPLFMSNAGPFIKKYDPSAKTAAIVGASGDPGDAVQAQAYEAGYKAVGLTVNPEGTYPVGSTDLTSAFAAANASSADVLSFAGSEGDCPGFYNAWKASGTKALVVMNPLCFSNALLGAYGGDFPTGWIDATANVLPTDTSDPAVVEYQKNLKKYGGKAAVTAGGDPFTQTGYAALLSTVKFINQAGGVKASAVKIYKKEKAFKGPFPMGPPHETCGAVKTAPNECNFAGLFYKYEGHGKSQLLAGGWIKAPAVKVG